MLKNSDLLKEENYFWKLTGRLKVSNINNIIKKTKNHNYFLQWIYSKNKLDTRFYKINKKVYEDNLLDAYKFINDNNGIAIENVFYKILNTRAIKYHCFKRYPVLDGISGSSGTKYKVSTLKTKIYSFLCCMGIYNTKIFRYLMQFLIKIKVSNK